MKLLLLSLISPSVWAITAVPNYVINLDLDPEDRYNDIIPDFNDTLWDYYTNYFLASPPLEAIIYNVSAQRGDENEEMMGEITGIARITQLPFEFVKSIQMLQEIDTMMVPVLNFSDMVERRARFPEGYEDFDMMPAAVGGSCTGIIAVNSNDGMVYHARNFDNSPTDTFQHLVYNAVFQSNGVEVFRSQMMAGYTMVVTAARGMGTANGYAIERNTRFASGPGENKQVIDNLIAGRELNGWILRQTLTEQSEFEDAVEILSTAPFCATEYVIMSGVKKGTILSRGPDGTVHSQVLGQSNYNEPDNYIIMTNFDYYWHDVKEFFDPSGGGGLGRGPSRRIAAQQILNTTDVLTPEVLYNTLNAPYVLADTVFQAIISIEANLWNTSIPVPYTP